MGRLAALKHLSTVDRRMVPSKIAYMLYGGYLGSYDPFLNLFFVSVGLSVSKAGFITGLMYAPPIIAGPIWGYLADRTGRRRLLLFILCVGAAFLLSSMPWLARALNEREVSSCNTTIPVSSSNGTNNSEIEFIFQENCRNVSRLFWTLFCVAISASLFLLPLPNYMETLVMNVVKTRPGRSSYGGQRVMGGIGMAVTSYFAGKVADHYNEPGMSSYTAIFFLFFPVAILFIPIGWVLISQGNYDNRADSEDKEKMSSKEEEATTTKTTTNLNQILYSTLIKVEILLFLLTVLVAGLANSTFVNFTYLRMKEMFKRSSTEMTYVFILANGVEVILYPFALKLIKVLGGPLNSIILAIFSNFLRFLVMSSDISFDIFVAVQLLNALSFALSVSAFMEYIHAVSPPEINMTMNAIMMIILRGAGGLVGNMFGGKIYEIYGSQKLFFGVSQVCLGWSMLMVVYYCCTKIKDWKKRNTPVEDEDDLDDAHVKILISDN